MLCGVSSPQGACGPLPRRLWGSSWAVLGASWAPLGWLPGRPGHQAGASSGVLEASRGRIGKDLTPKWSQVGTKVS